MASKSQKEKASALKISTDTYNEVIERDDYTCALCKTIGLHKSITNFMPPLECHHIVAKSHSGMGIARNLIILCKYHHQDCTSHREDIEIYMKSKYDDWDKEDLIWKK